MANELPPMPDIPEDGVWRTVRAKVREYKPYRLMAFAFTPESGPIAVASGSGDVLTGAAIAEELAKPSAIPWAVVVSSAGDFWDYLEAHGQEASAEPFEASGTTTLRRGYTIDGGFLPEYISTFTSFRWGKYKANLVLDPASFSDQPLEKILGMLERDLRNPYVTLVRLHDLGEDILNFCLEAGIALKPSRGSLASQFLLDQRFFPAERRKVPKFINALALPYLPGNMYRLWSKRLYTNAVELDQKASHHQIAERLNFPDPDHIGAFGYVDEEDWDNCKFLIRPNDERWQEVTSYLGLFFVRVKSEDRKPDSTVHPSFDFDGERVIAVWSNELDELFSIPSMQVLGIVGALISFKSCTSLSDYARFALAQLSSASQLRMRWLKPVLLSVYGLLAQGASPIEKFYTQPKRSSQLVLMALGGRLIEAHVVTSKRAREPVYADVISRGLIEAETRMESIRIARAVKALEAKIEAELIAIYADSVVLGFRAGDGEEHREAMRDVETAVSEHGKGRWGMQWLRQLQFFAPNSFESLEKSKLPGVPRKGRKPKPPPNGES